MTEPIRDALQRLTEAVVSGTIPDIRDAVNCARAALAEPADGPPAGAEGPSDEELMATIIKATVNFPPSHPQAQPLYVVEYQLALELRKARAVLARWGNHSPNATEMVPPAEGEVAELVKYLRDWGDDYAVRTEFHRAAELLECHAAPVPVPVAERLPGPEDCDAEGRCWLHGKVEGDWRLINPAKSGVPLRYCFSHWLPASALPLPASQGGEVES